jgi:hypothetical protein
VTGNITGNYFIGNGSQLTGIVTYTNVNVASYLASNSNVVITTTGNITAPYFIGNIQGNIDAGGANTQIQFNDSGSFGATANLSFDKASNKLFLSGHQVFANTATPANVANAVALYSNAVSSGGTGLYFTSASANDELVSKSAAIVFAIIF